jgi:DNA-binding FadR family transcriptional regulator
VYIIHHTIIHQESHSQSDKRTFLALKRSIGSLRIKDRITSWASRERDDGVLDLAGCSLTLTTIAAAAAAAVAAEVDLLLLKEVANEEEEEDDEEDDEEEDVKEEEVKEVALSLVPQGKGGKTKSS